MGDDGSRWLLYIFHAIEIVEIEQPTTAHQPDPLAHHPITCRRAAQDSGGLLPPDSTHAYAQQQAKRGVELWISFLYSITITIIQIFNLI